MRAGRLRIRAGFAPLLLLFCCCFILAAILACQSLGNRPKAFASSRRAAVQLTAGSTHSQSAWRTSFWLTVGSPWRNQGVLMEELAVRAKAEAKRAMEQELVAQAKIKAVLARQEKKHRILVKELKAEGWQTSISERVSRGSIIRGRLSLEQYLTTADYNAFRLQRQLQMQGRGILIAAGGPIPLANAYVALHMLRNVHRCMLPIEVYHNGAHELDNVTKAAFESEFEAVKCIDVGKHRLPEHLQRAQSGHVLSRQQRGWVLKAQMLYATSFEQVLVLDADNLPLTDPTFLFDSPEFAESGNLFWPDFWSSNWHNPGPLYELLNLTEPWDATPDLLTTESGQFLLDRRRFDAVLEWVMFLNLHADIAYAILWGDKDTYRLAFTLAGAASNFRQVDQRPANALYAPHLHAANQKEASKKKDAAYAHAGMLQMSPTGLLLFLHRTAGSKLDPNLDYAADYRAVDFITPPLSPRQAAHIHTTGPMAVSKFDAAKLQSCTQQDLNLVDAVTECEGPRSIHGYVRARLSDSFPVPLFASSQFSGFQELIDESMAAFRRLQKRFRSRQILLGAPKESW